MKLADRRLLELLDRRSLGELNMSGKTVLVALSGGADSVALLRALALYSNPVNLGLVAVHVNHGIRMESADEEAFVVKLCQTLGIDLRVHKLQLGQKPQRTSPEQFWRERRYDALGLTFEEFRADYVALGHTADDLAETFLYHLVRGTSPQGLAFHFFTSSDTGEFPIVRPLWKTRRADIEEALTGAGQEWVNDPSNLDLRLSRNRIRKEVVPALEHINPTAVEAIVNFADKLACYIERTDLVKGSDLLQFDTTPCLRGMPYKKVCSVVHQFLINNGKLSHATRHVEQAADMIRESTSGLVALPDSRTLVITQKNAWLYNGAEPTELELAGEHCRRFGDFAADLSGQTADADSQVEIKALGGQSYLLSADPTDHIKIRNRKPGDRVGPKSLKKLLIEYHVPWYLRNYLILATTGEGQVVDILTDVKPLKDWVNQHSVAPVSLTLAKTLPSA